MVSDFLYPNAGGVENHIYQLSQCLISRGHKVVILTHCYGERSGVRYLTNGLKVYYAPRQPVYCQVTLPTIFGGFRLLRVILIREGITLVHAHQAFSVMGHEAILHARTMGYKVVFTDHSLFGFADASSILTNKVLKFSLADVHEVICVSHTSKENTVLRACLSPHHVWAIPNAVDASQFKPDVSKRRPGRLTVVALSRLVYRKGIDLLVVIIPEMCYRYPQVDFVIGGGGPKADLLKEMIAEEGLESRVEMVGPVPHEKARDLLVRGDIFINASLTEAFCMAIVEAAAAGLMVVSTAVGGVPEVLPDGMVLLAEPNPDSLLAALEEAVHLAHTVDPLVQHHQIHGFYNWPRIAARTEKVYEAAVTTWRDDSLMGRFCRYYQCGSWFGKICCCVAAVLHLYWKWLEAVCPRTDIEIAVSFQCPVPDTAKTLSTD
ncbi:hypothetical protein WJX82_011610 [Trebouxia sp. C0006]